MTDMITEILNSDAVPAAEALGVEVKNEGDTSSSVVPDNSDNNNSGDSTPSVPSEVIPEPTQPSMDDILDALMTKIQPVATLNPYLRVLIYGEPGTRKTSFSATSPVPIILETDIGGAKSLMNAHEGMPNLSGTMVLPYKSMYQVNILLDALIEDNERFARFGTLIIDTYTGLQAKDLAALPVLSDGRPDYNNNTANMKELTDKLRRVQKHVIITTHVKEDKDATTGVILKRPDLTPKVAQAVAGMFDVIGYMDVTDDGTWTLRLTKTNAISAKSRVGGLPDVIENPRFSVILDAYTKMLNNATVTN